MYPVESGEHIEDFKDIIRFLARWFSEWCEQGELGKSSPRHMQ